MVERRPRRAAATRTFCRGLHSARAAATRSIDPGSARRSGPGQPQPAASPNLVDSWEAAHRLEHELSGNLLGQETCREFAQLSSDDLGTRVPAGYSDFAERLEAFVEEKVNQAAHGRQSFLRQLGV